jgi:hypothetical protein
MKYCHIGAPDEKPLRHLPEDVRNNTFKLVILIGIAGSPDNELSSGERE